MGKPAARLGDMTSHGGTIVLGFPTVLIGGMPAARIGDMHVCPMVTPGTPPIPHVGGPVTLGSPMVLIGGMPAARVGDMCVCVGPPDTIAMGCFTVLIGEGGSGSGSGGGAMSSGSASAEAGAKNATGSKGESTTKEKNWIEFEFTDKAGNPITGINYKFNDPSSNESKGILRTDGRVVRDAMDEGECKVVLYDIYGAKWSKDSAKIGDKLKLSVKSLGLEDGEKVEFNVFVKDIKYADHLLAKLKADISGDKAEVEWEINADDEFLKISETKKESGGYSQPFFYFDVYSNDLTAKSPLLFVEDWIELLLKDDEGNALADKKYRITLPSGEIKEGTLDSSGKVKLEKVPPGIIDITIVA